MAMRRLRDLWLMRALGWVGRHPVRNLLLYLLAVVLVAAGAYALGEGGEVSYLDGVWWAVVTLTTVGYGDISPSSVGMRLVAVWVMASGIFSVAIITGVVAAKLSVAAIADADRTPGIDDDFDKLSDDLAHVVERVRVLQERFRGDERGDDEVTAAAREVVAQSANGGVKPESIERLRDAVDRQEATDA